MDFNQIHIENDKYVHAIGKIDDEQYKIMEEKERIEYERERERMRKESKNNEYKVPEPFIPGT